MLKYVSCASKGNTMTIMNLLWDLALTKNGSLLLEAITQANTMRNIKESWESCKQERYNLRTMNYF